MSSLSWWSCHLCHLPLKMCCQGILTVEQLKENRFEFLKKKNASLSKKKIKRNLPNGLGTVRGSVKVWGCTEHRDGHILFLMLVDIQVWHLYEGMPAPTHRCRKLKQGLMFAYGPPELHLNSDRTLEQAEMIKPMDGHVAKPELGSWAVVQNDI